MTTSLPVIPAHPPTAPPPLRPLAGDPYVRRTDAAVRVMTDFVQQPALTIAEERCVDDALNDMFRFGVHCLLVSTADSLTGLVTSYEIQRERPMSLTASADGAPRSELCVRDLMTPASDLPAIDWTTVCEARISDLLEIFLGTGTTHLIVLETLGDGSTRVRGLFSRNRLERQLGRSDEVWPVPRSWTR